MSKTTDKIALEPKTIWDELANYSLLIDYMNNFLEDKTSSDPELKAKMFDSIYQHYDKVCPEAEIYFAEKYIDSIQYFLDKVEACRKL